MSSRKRKVEDDDDVSYGFGGRQGARESSSGADNDDRMSASPSNSPAIAPRSAPRSITARGKRLKPNVSGRRIAMNRVLETLDVHALRSLLLSVCERHPEMSSEVVNLAPAPTVDTALEVLARYQLAFRASFPFGGSSTSDYAYNRVRQAFTDLLDALGDFTPHFLPPNENHAFTSLRFLDGATVIVHQLPTWDDNAHNHHKNLAYEEISKAWALVIKEAAKRGAGIQLQFDGWDQKLAKHNELSHGRMQTAMEELRSCLGWMGAGQGMSGGDATSIRDQLLSGTYGSNLAVPVGFR